MTRDKEIALRIELDDAVDKIICDPRRIQQALNNLIGNAVKYTPAGGEIIIKTAANVKHSPLPGAGAETEKAGVTVSVQDKGYGIKAEYLPHVFERFYRVQTEQTKNIEGTGLGLAIIKSIVEQHGGEIWVESEVGTGSTFSFTL
ncbi:MAG: hypothetical protein B6243_08625 [Anaerolineaceae bacterium 4572_5.2]|nr:MAG: hypothetical protein B6243_08625 [Anaerolineaceae bacterium 4572_5.2]